MDVQRAKEIAGSPDLIDVSYYGVAVYIQQVDESAGTARVYPKEAPGDKQTVPLDALSEEFNEPDLPFV